MKKFSFIFILLSGVQAILGFRDLFAQEDPRTQQGQTPQDYYYAAVREFALGKTDEAMKHLEEGIKHFPQSPYLKNALGNIYIVQYQYREALPYLSEALKLYQAQGDFESVDVIDLHKGLAVVYAQLAREEGWTRELMSRILYHGDVYLKDAPHPDTETRDGFAELLSQVLEGWPMALFKEKEPSPNTAKDATGLPVVTEAVLARGVGPKGHVPRASGAPKGRPLTPPSKTHLPEEEISPDQVAQSVERIRAWLQVYTEEKQAHRVETEATSVTLEELISIIDQRIQSMPAIQFQRLRGVGEASQVIEEVWP